MPAASTTPEATTQRRFPPSEPPFETGAAPTQFLPPPIPTPAAGFPPIRLPAAPELPDQEKSLLDTRDRRRTGGADAARAAHGASPRRRPFAQPHSRQRRRAKIGGLIFALQQKPSSTPYKFAAIVSIIWGALGAAFVITSIGTDSPVLGWLDILGRPTTFLTVAAIIVPIAPLWLMALLAWRTEELRLRSSTMTEVAIRLAEPDRLAEQNAASLGQAVRRQVGFMNDAVSRALGRAGELEAMVHNEVACWSAPTRRTSARSAASFPSFPASATPSSTPPTASPKA